MGHQARVAELRFLTQQIYANPERARDVLTASMRAAPRWGDLWELERQLQPVLAAVMWASREELRRQLREIARQGLQEHGAYNDAASALYWATNP